MKITRKRRREQKEEWKRMSEKEIEKREGERKK